MTDIDLSPADDPVVTCHLVFDGDVAVGWVLPTEPSYSKYLHLNLKKAPSAGKNHPTATTPKCSVATGLAKGTK